MPSTNIGDQDPLIAEEAIEEQSVDSEGVDKGPDNVPERRNSLRSERDREWRQSLHFAIG